MILAFMLSMPSNSAWNGKWTGDGKIYAIVHNFGRGKKAAEAAAKIRDKGYYTYNFGDGWTAGITVKEVDAKEARRIRAKSGGFWGYDWMVESIRMYGEIKTT